MTLELEKRSKTLLEKHPGIRHHNLIFFPNKTDKIAAGYGAFGKYTGLPDSEPVPHGAVIMKTYKKGDNMGWRKKHTHDKPTGHTLGIPWK